MPKLECKFVYKGFPCVVLFMPHGYRCGYVGLPKSNKYHGKHYNFIPVNCHGGLTYSNRTLCHCEEKDLWWIGFDCGHCFDGYDIEHIEKYYSNNVEIMEQLKYMRKHFEEMNKSSVVCDLEYVKSECRKIVDQLTEV